MFGSGTSEKSQLQVVREKVTALYFELRKGEPSPPAQVFHYTNSHGLLGIVTSHKLWASGADFLNDSSEPEYALRVLKQSVEEIGRGLEDDSIVARSLRGMWNYMEDEYKRNGPHVYVSCFSEHGDLLSQWRGYGGGCAGYAIGFSGPRLCEPLVPGNGQFMMKIVYDEGEQREEARRTLGQIIAIAKQVETSLTDTQGTEIEGQLRSAIFAEVVRLRAKFKAKAFEEEHEWRIVQFIPASGIVPGSEVRFRAGNEVIKPYLELDLGKLPIEEVTVGPTLDFALSKQSLGLLFTRHGYSNLCIKESGVPYRQ